MNHQRNHNQSFKSARLVFDTSKGPKASPSDADVLAEAAKKAMEKTKDDPDRKNAIEKGREIAKRNAKLPKLSGKAKGLKLNNKPQKKGSSVEQNFEFGDLKIPGKIVMPAEPKKGEKTTILFNYVDDPGKFDHGKFVKELKESDMDLGNTMIVTLRTPEGQTKIGKEKMNTMSTLVSDIEKFQRDLAKNPDYKNFKNMDFTRAQDVLHIASKGEAPKVKYLLEEYKKNARSIDSRTASIGKNVSISVKSLSEEVKAQEEAIKAAEAEEDADGTEVDVEDTITGGGGGYSGGGGGGGTGGGGAMESGDSGSEMETITGSETSSEGSEEETTSTEVESEPGEGVHKLLVVGDSLLNHSGGKLEVGEGKPNLEAQKGGKSAEQLARILTKMDGDGKLEEYKGEKMVVNCGVNDIANNCLNYMRGRSKIKLEESGEHKAYQDFVFAKIMKTYEKIWEIAKVGKDPENPNKIAVYQNTLAPFRNANLGAKLENFYAPPGRPDIADANNRIRERINAELIAREGKPNGPDKIIPIHLTQAEGGLADNNNPNFLHKEYAAGDNLHVRGTGITRMTEIMQGVLGPPIKEKPEGKVRETREIEPGIGVDMVKCFGDSNMVPLARHIKSRKPNKTVSTAVDGKALATMAGEVEGGLNDGSLAKLNTEISNGTIVINGGGNDLAAGATAIDLVRQFERIAKAGKKAEVRVFICAITPFDPKGKNYPSLQGPKINIERREANRKLRELADSPEYKGIVNVIPLDEAVPIGVADPKNEDRLYDGNDPELKEKGVPKFRSNDGVHMHMASFSKVGEIVQRHIGAPISAQERTGETAVARREKKSSVEGIPGIKLISNAEGKKRKGGAYIDNSNKQEYYAWAKRINQQLITSGTPINSYVEINYNGKILIGKHVLHNISGATGKRFSTPRPATEMYEAV